MRLQKDIAVQYEVAGDLLRFLTTRLLTHSALGVFARAPPAETGVRLF